MNYVFEVIGFWLVLLWFTCLIFGLLQGIIYIFSKKRGFKEIV